MTTETDDLVERAKKGDERAESELFSQLIVRFRNFATCRIGADRADDLAMETCKIVLEKYKTVEFRPGFDAWAHGVFKNVLRNHYRKVKGMNREVDLEAESDPRMRSSTGWDGSDHELRLTLIECLEQMRKGYSRYTRILKRVYQGHPTGEICDEFAIKPNNFYVILKRGREMLKRCLETGSV